MSLATAHEQDRSLFLAVAGTCHVQWGEVVRSCNFYERESTIKSSVCAGALCKQPNCSSVIHSTQMVTVGSSAGFGLALVHMWLVWSYKLYIDFGMVALAFATSPSLI